MLSRYDKYKKSYEKYRKANKERIKNMQQTWRMKQLDRLRKKSLNYNREKEFGGNWRKCLDRDKWKCVKCGMTSEQHLSLYGRNLTIDHIDCKGRYSKEKNNNLNNLQTLCLNCHGKKDIYNRKVINNMFTAKKGIKKNQEHRKIKGQEICYCKRKMVFIYGMWICLSRIKILPNSKILKVLE